MFLYSYKRIFFPLLISSIVLFGCKEPSAEKKEAITKQDNSVSKPSQAFIDSIKSKFPMAVEFGKGMDSIVHHLKDFGIAANGILWGQSTCVDDITNTKNKLPAGIKGPFNFGGLGGLPFTGITGLDAFAHHVPEEGTAVLFVAPHIGYNEKEGWGRILRHEQHHPSSCCGALVGALAKLNSGNIKTGAVTMADYQEAMIEQLALNHRDQILGSAEPLIAFTQLVYQEAIRELSDYVTKVKERHFKYAVVVRGIIINTDYDLPDFLWIDSVSILNVQKNQWVE